MQEVFIDAFSGGQFMTRSELHDILMHIVPDHTNPVYLAGVRHGDVWYAPYSLITTCFVMKHLLRMAIICCIQL